jgi:DNA modification methylase
MPVIDQIITPEYALYNADCMELLPSLPDESIDMECYSPPFPELYQYSDDPRDMTNCTSYEESIEQYAYIARELARLLKPGRMCCVHCTDLRHGALYQHDFPGDLVRVHQATGLRFFCRVSIWKDPWHFARRTRMKTLMHKTIVEDSSCSRIAPADFILVFRKPGTNAAPITHPHGFREYYGSRGIPQNLAAEFGNFKGDPRENRLSHWIYRQYASPVWFDIRRDRLLPFDQARETDEEKHACPLQLDAIDRCIAMWSNGPSDDRAGDLVLSPFAGVGSEIHEAIRMGRRAIGCELKQTYFRQMVVNMQHAATSVLTTEYAMTPPPEAEGHGEGEEPEDEEPEGSDELPEPVGADATP